MTNFWKVVFVSVVSLCSLDVFSDYENLKTPPNFLLSAQANALVVTAGGTCRYNVNVKPLGSFKESIQFFVSDLPKGVLPTLDANPFSVVLTLKTPKDIKDGIYIFKAHAKSGAIERKQDLALCVMSRSDFSMTVEPATQTIQVGDSASYKVNVEGLDGKNSIVDFYVTDLPIGGQPSFVKDSCSSNAVFTVSTGRTPPGDNLMTVHAVSGSIVHTFKVGLTMVQ